MLTGKELGAAIAEALSQNNRTQADAARHFGVASPSVTGWIKTGRISKDNFDRLRSWLSKTPDSHWGAMSPAITAESSVEPQDTHGSGVPLISWVQAGCWAVVADPHTLGDADDWLPCPVRHGPRTYANRPPRRFFFAIRSHETSLCLPFVGLLGDALH